MLFCYWKQLCDCKISSFRMHHNAKHGLFYSGMPANGWNIDLSFPNRQCHAVNFMQSSATTATQASPGGINGYVAVVKWVHWSNLLAPAISTIGY